MHDPMVVAHDIRRPWPQLHRRVTEYERRIQWAKWWDIRPKVFRAFWRFGPIELYWPSLITVWHNEPGGHDSLTVCKHKGHWRWHIHHWSIQVHPMQHLRRWVLTRCEWCGGRSRKGDYVNFSHQWDREPGRWWRGERGLFHSDCSSVESAHRTCLCGIGPFENNNYGRCASCGKFRAWRRADEDRRHGEAATRIYAALGSGERPHEDLREQVKALWDEQRSIDEAQRAKELDA